VIGIASSWFLLPVRTTDVTRRDLVRALGALSDYVAAARSDPAALPDHEVRITHAAAELNRVGNIRRLVPRRWRGSLDYLSALAALQQCAAALPKVSALVMSRARDGHRLDTRPLAAVDAEISALRHGLAERTEPDPVAWTRLAETVIRLPVTLATSPPADLPAAHERAPRDRLWAPTERILGYVNRTHATHYRLIERLAGSFHSATYLINNPAGRRAVLKWSRDPSRAHLAERAAPVLATARHAGWPAPASHATGTTPSGYPYQLLEHAPGEPAGRVTEQLVRVVLPILDLQAGLAPDTEQDWTAYDHGIAFGNEGGHAGTVAAFSAEGAALVDAIRAWTLPFQHVVLPRNDLVHGSLSPGNMLFDGDQLTALTGTDTIGKGSRLHDLATIAAHAMLGNGDPGALTRLLDYSTRHARPGEFEISLAACFLAFLSPQVTHDADGANLSLKHAAESLHQLHGPGTQSSARK